MAASYERRRAASSACATNFPLLPRQYRAADVLLQEYAPGALAGGRLGAARPVL
jgi:hypothetical protein